MSVFDLFKKKAPESKVASPAVSGPPAERGEIRPLTPAEPQSQQPQSGPAQSERSDGEKTGESASFFGRLRQGLKKTADLLNTDIRDLFKKEGRLVDDAFLQDLFAVLVRTDMGAGPAQEIRDEIQRDFRARVVHMEEVLSAIRAKLRQLMEQPESPLEFQPSGPTVIMVVGVNGSGKTTSIAKLAYTLHAQGKKVVLGAGDTFRAAAVEQLTIWANRIGVDIVKGEPRADPASVAHRALSQALATQADVCIIDTAGRLQTQSNLMQELGKIRRVLAKLIADAPHEVLLVLDATAGQNGISQARGFSEAAGCTGIILAKLDGTAKGGVVIPIRRQFQLPVKYVGLGEKPADFAVFNADQFVAALFSDRLS